MKKMTFEQLTTKQLYALCKLRQDVFMVEQNSIYLDLDALDQEAIHYLDVNEHQELVAYARYRYVEHAHIKIERVVLRKDVRGKGRGKLLLGTILTEIRLDMPTVKISLSAQINALQFYHLLGFVEQGEPYDDGGIEHISMFYQG